MGRSVRGESSPTAMLTIECCTYIVLPEIGEVYVQQQKASIRRVGSLQVHENAVQSIRKVSAQHHRHRQRGWVSNSTLMERPDALEQLGSLPRAKHAVQVGVHCVPTS